VVDLRISSLARILEETVPRIPEPREELEQYTTPAELALRVSSYALIKFKNAVVADLGAGTCRIALASLLLGASKVVAVDVDPRLPPLCMDAARRLGLEDRLLYVISYVFKDSGLLKNVDVIISNPPFGVKRRGADREFLEFSMRSRVPLIIAIVKSGNFNFHRGLALREGYEARLLWSEPFPIPASMPKHRSRIRRVLVDVIEFRRGDGART
jgi:putative methylase